MAEAERFDIIHSAVGAFIGRIRPSFRRVSASARQYGGLVRDLRVVVIVDDGLDAGTLDDIREDVSVAITEMIADLPGATPMPMRLLDEEVVAVSGPLPPASHIDGVIFERWEASA